MTFYQIFIEEFGNIVYILLFIASVLVLFYLLYKLRLKYLRKLKEKNDVKRSAIIIKEEVEIDLGFNELQDQEKFQKDVKEIMKAVETDSTVRVPFAKAL